MPVDWASVRECRLSACRASADFLAQPDENALGAADVAKPITSSYWTTSVRTSCAPCLAEPGERIVEVVDGEHDTQVAQSVHRYVPVIGDNWRREKSRIWVDDSALA